MLEIRSCQVRRNNFTLDVKELTLHAGITVLAGPNGAGKSTLFAALSGHGPRPHLEARLNGIDYQTSHAAYMPQSPRLPTDLTVRDLLTHCAWLEGASWRQAKARATSLLERIDLTEDGAKLVSQLSGGMQRRLAFAVSLVRETPVLLLDEPTNDLDPIQRREFLSTVTEQAEDRIVVISTHSLHEVLPIAQCIAVMDAGQIAYEGSAPEFLAAFSPENSQSDDAFAQCLRQARAGRE